MTDELLTEREVAAILKLAPATLRAWRHKGTPNTPSYVKVGGSVRYSRSSVEAYVRLAAAGVSR